MVQLPNLSILIADDVEQNLELLRLTLESHGHSVVSAMDGEQAFNAYKNNTFDVILMDVHMPNVDGLQACCRIRKYERRQGLERTPIIALTASVMAHDREAASNAGMDGFAVKPLDIPSLFQEIANVLELEQKAATESAPAAASSSKPDSSHDTANIDWGSGILLWGSKAKLAAEISSFLAGAVAKYQLNDDKQEGSELQFNLHGLRGAAANLALKPLAQCAAELEQLCRTGQPEQALVRLPELLALIKRATADLPAVVQPAQVPAAELVTPEQLEQACQDLQRALQHHELNDAAAAIVCTAMDSDTEQLFKQALEDFDFKKASAVFQQWQEDKNE